MQKLSNLLHRITNWEQWQVLYILLSLSWLLGPSLNHHISARLAFASQYEDPGQSWSWLFRLCDTLGALLLGLAVGILARRRRPLRLFTSFYGISVLLLGIIALGSFIDAAFPSACHADDALCLIPVGISSIVHSVESVGTACALIAVNLVWVYRNMPWAKTVLFIQLVWGGAFIANQLAGRPDIGLIQFAYEIVVILWTASIVPVLASRRTGPNSSSRLQIAAHGIAAWVFLGGFFSIVTAIRNIHQVSDLSAAYFGNNTAWLSQHGVAVGIILMYISRHLWRGEYRAWQLTSLLLWLETLKYSIVTPDADLAVLYGVTAAVLFTLRRLFDRQTSVEELRDRLVKLAFVAVAFIAALTLGVLAYRFKHHQDLDSLRFNAGQFYRHLFLFDVVNDLGPLQRRLLGQVLNVAGIALLLAILISLFRPHKPLLRPFNEHDRNQLRHLLGRYSTSSEDYFKYWPQPKSYWWSVDRDAVIAYRVVGNVAFALADPVAPDDEARQRMMKHFLEFCRRYGWRACFIMIAGQSHELYKQSGYKLLRIGASAVVNIDEFSTTTARNKWWRWVLNKAKRQGWKYAVIAPPYNSQLIAELRQVSESWLTRQNHVERSFALGYFDEAYLQSCRLHLLREENGTLIAFANELPTFNGVQTATIDLMRFLPEHNHAMSALLAHSIQQLHEEGAKQSFDLGFVPLASPSDRTEQIIQKFGQLLMSEAVSAQGLEQFKNKFAPAWVDNYIAFDGDWIDLVHITRQLDALLKPEP
ncbi:MAG TPA: phosphatidylglycerol lysyltransferase domain-containing protein [Candidatus Saccharimonadales bacterium]|nr:phosphatidylglycerol lysyltransferase domain-containing protein [Candidatus Saccharimonadales bacterium]